MTQKMPKTKNYEALCIWRGMMTMAHGLSRDHHTVVTLKWGQLRCHYDPAGNKMSWTLRDKPELLTHEQLVSLINIELEDNAQAKMSAKVEIH